MFRVTLKISQERHSSTSRSRRQKCQLLLVAISLFSVLGLFLTSCYNRNGIVPNTFNETTNGTFISNSTNKIWGRMGALNISLKEIIARSSCVIKDCSTIHCSSVPDELDPGEVASNFIESDFKIDCGKVKSIALVFKDCKFPSDTIRKDWLDTDLTIDELTLTNSFLTNIEDDAFQASQFSQMKALTIINNTIRRLRKSIFQHLLKLKFLTIRDNIVDHVEVNLLENQAYSLENLELDCVLVNSISLENITGGTTLGELQLLSLRRNVLTEIRENAFLGAPKVKSLFLDASQIKRVHPEAFNPMSKSIFILSIGDNSITSLAEGFFDPIVRRNPNFRVSLENNPFHCDCGLQWMQNFIREYPVIIRTIPECESPKSNQGLSFTRANFCQNVSTKITSTETTIMTESTENTRPTIMQRTIRVWCNNFQSLVMESIKSRELLWTADYELTARYSGLSATETESNEILVKLPHTTMNLALLWFESTEPERSLHCEKNVKNSYLVQYVKPSTSYSFCLLQENENFVSPLNCLAITTNADYDSNLWLTNADKSIVFYASVACFLTLCPCIAALTFIILRRHPSLLKGSKRVMMVKKRDVDAIVLPKGMKIPSEARHMIDRDYRESDLLEDGYVTPLPPLPLPPLRTDTTSKNLSRKYSRISGMSVQSDGNTYVSGVEPTIPQMVSWKLKRLKSRIDQTKPPLPPREVPSISSAMRSNENIYSENLFYTV